MARIFLPNSWMCIFPLRHTNTSLHRFIFLHKRRFICCLPLLNLFKGRQHGREVLHPEATIGSYILRCVIQQLLLLRGATRQYLLRPDNLLRQLQGEIPISFPMLPQPKGPVSRGKHAPHNQSSIPSGGDSLWTPAGEYPPCCIQRPFPEFPVPGPSRRGRDLLCHFDWEGVEISLTFSSKYAAT